MRADVPLPLRPGDWITVSAGLYAGIDGRVIEVREASPLSLRARLSLPWGEDHWQPMWNEPMIEAEWLNTTDTAALERCLFALEEPPSERKSWLFACACFRRVEAELPDDLCREALESCERFADGRATAREFHSLLGQAARLYSLRAWAGLAAQPAGPRTANLLAGMRHAAWRFRQTKAEADAQRDLLRDVFGNPFRAAFLARSTLRWQGGLVVQLARAIYEERRWREMPVLADALEDAGCSDGYILEHCRSGKPHARGCWLVDGLLGKH
jgi:hypothetical protein